MKKRLMEAAHRLRCWLDVAGWICWDAWMASAEEMRDQAGYEDGTR